MARKPASHGHSNNIDWISYWIIANALPGRRMKWKIWKLWLVGLSKRFEYSNPIRIRNCSNQFWGDFRISVKINYSAAPMTQRRETQNCPFYTFILSNLIMVENKRLSFDILVIPSSTPSNQESLCQNPSDEIVLYYPFVYKIII